VRIRLESSRRCPHCDRKMHRSLQARIGDQFCPRCREDRIVESGGQIGLKDRVYVVDSAGYARFTDLPARLSEPEPGQSV